MGTCFLLASIRLRTSAFILVLMILNKDVTIEAQNSTTLRTEVQNGTAVVAPLLQKKPKMVSNSTQTDEDSVSSVESTEKPILVTGLILAVAAACTSVLAIIVLVIIVIFAIRCYWDRPSKAPPYGSPYTPGDDQNFVPVFVDRKMAQSAQMFFYQYQKQQLLAQESEQKSHQSAESDSCSEPEAKDGQVPMMSCPGLAMESGGDLEVRNPMFVEDVPTWNGSVATDDEGSPQIGGDDGTSSSHEADGSDGVKTDSSAGPSSDPPQALPSPQPPPSSPSPPEMSSSTLSGAGDATDMKATDVNKNLTLRDAQVKPGSAEGDP